MIEELVERRVELQKELRELLNESSFRACIERTRIMGEIEQLNERIEIEKIRIR